MLFSSPFFIFLFLPIFFAVFFTTPKKYQNIVLLLGSLGFYFWGEPIFCLIAIASATVDYWLCIQIKKSGIHAKTARRYLIIGIFSNLFLLIYYKYTNFVLS